MAERKISKDEANYRTNAMRKQCQACDMFRAPSSCTLVDGYISRFATCRFWEAKKKGGDERA